MTELNEKIRELADEAARLEIRIDEYEHHLATLLFWDDIYVVDRSMTAEMRTRWFWDQLGPEKQAKILQTSDRDAVLHG